MSNEIVIGIDLGTTYSCVAYFDNCKVDIIANDQGNRTTPSYVAFTNDEILVGDSAKIQASSNTKNTIFDVKRLMGKKFDNIINDNDYKRLSKHYDIISDNNIIKIKTTYKNETKLSSPEEISSKIISKMKNIAESYIGKPVTSAVITVPAYFNNEQREATKLAGTISNLKVLRILNEPTAAAIAYGLDKHTEQSNVLIFDLGGGTFDVSILSIDDGIFEVLATDGDTHLGGEDFDENMFNHFVEEFKKKYKQDITKDPRACRRLLTACERAKRTLSVSSQAYIEIDSLYNGIDYNSTITRAKFENLNKGLFEKTIQCVNNALSQTKLDKSRINEIVLVGGSTRIPKIQELLTYEFNGKRLNKSIHPDEAVAYGAAVQGAILSGNKSSNISDLLLIDVAPLSLGIETGGNTMTKLIDRNSTVPTQRTQVFTTYMNNQPAVSVKVYEGERLLSKDNNLIGSFELSNLPKMPKGEPRIEVKFDIDANGILTVSATELSSKIENKITITNDRNKYSKEDIEKMIKEAEQFEEEDKKRIAFIESKNNLEQYTLNIKSSIDTDKENISSEDYNLIETKCNDIMDWIEKEESKNCEDYDNKRKELEDIVKPILKN